MSRRTVLLRDELFLRHDTGHGHPERAERLRAIHARLTEGALCGAFRELDATRDVAAEDVERVHRPGYFDAVLNRIRREAPCALDHGDTQVAPASLIPILRAAGAGLTLADLVLGGEATNGFAIVRPPGHHAEAATPLGFCVFNNVAILARYLQARWGLTRIAIVDFDVHHGNGTQNAFYEDPDVFFASLHQYPFYPGTGSHQERGRGAGYGTTLNVPLPHGSGPDAFLRAFDERVLDAVRDHAPQAILISAGFDAHRDDPLGGLRLESRTFYQLTRALTQLARELGHGRVLTLLEGGYDLRALAESAEEHLRALVEDGETDDP